MILPTVPRVENGEISAAMLLLKAKQFDDGLYAAVELAAQQGRGPCSLARQRCYALWPRHSLLTRLKTDPVAAARIHAACDLGGVGTATPACWQEAVERMSKCSSRMRPGRSLWGFTPGVPSFVRDFQQDRLLQEPLEPGPTKALALTLDRTPAGWDRYRAHLRLAARLTNPTTADPIPSPGTVYEEGKHPAFFPASRSHEVQLFHRLYENGPIPQGFDLMKELIHRVRTRQVSLKPVDNSGWYDYQNVVAGTTGYAGKDGRGRSPSSSETAIASTWWNCSREHWPGP